MKRAALLSLLFATAAGGAACSAQHSEQPAPVAEKTSSTSDALTLSQGVYPYPVAMQADGVTPQRDAQGHVVVAWKGSLADLMAADAWVDCAEQWGGIYDESWTDTYIRYLQTQMAADQSCQPGCQGNCGWTIWYGDRASSTCNYNTSNQAPQALTFDTRDISAYAAFGKPGGPFAKTPVGRAKLGGYTQLGVAEENLCMAQKLREEMVTAPGLLLQEADGRELLEVIRERAQIAMLQYGLLGVAFTSPSTAAPTTYDPNQILPLLRAFANDPNNVSQLTQIGRDFAAAVELHAQITQELASDLARNASARTPWPGAPFGQPALDWSDGSWRERVLRLLYGGDPLAATGNGTGAGASKDSLWQVYPGTNSPRVPTGYVSVDSRTPHVDELMALARKADALYFLQSDVAAGAATGAGFATTAAQLYRTVEASLRFPDCTSPGATAACTTHAWDPSIPDPATQATQALLYQHGITLADAVALSARLGQAMPGENAGVPYEGPLHFSGAQTVVATLTGTTSGPWYHLAPTTRIVPPSMAERGSRYLTSFYMPMQLDMLNAATTQGFIATVNGEYDDRNVNGSNAMRDLGAVSALAAAQDALFTVQFNANGSAATTTAKAFANAAAAASPVITAAIGSRTASIRPTPGGSVAVTGDSCVEWGDTCTSWNNAPPANCSTAQPTSCNVAAQATSANGNPSWQITVQTTSPDSYNMVIVTPGDPMAATAALDLGDVSYTGMTMTKVIGEQNAGIASASNGQKLPNGTFRTTFTVPFPYSGPPFFDGPPMWVFLEQPTESSLYPNRYQLVFGPQQLETQYIVDTNAKLYKSYEGRWMSMGGSLNAFAEKLWTTQPENWSQPQYDALGIATNWFPPPAELVGGVPGQSAASLYLSLAQSSATTASNAISKAVSELLAEESDQATLANAQQKAQAISSNTQKGLCGGSTTCTADLVSKTFPLLAGDPYGNNSKFVPQMSCAAAGLAPAQCSCAGLPAGQCQSDALVATYNSALANVIPAQVYLPAAVWQERWDGALPSFASYQGGTLQSDFIASWGALNGIQRAAITGLLTLGAKMAAANAAEATLIAATTVADYECSTQAFKSAFDAGRQGDIPLSGMDLSIPANDPSSPPYPYYKGDQSWSMGPLWTQIQSCESATAAKGPAAAQAAASIADAWATAGQQVQAIVSAVNALGIASAKVWTDAQAANVAQSQAQLDATLTAAGLQTRFGTARRFYSLDMFNAAQAMQNARINAVLARRAIESRYVVDLSTLLAPETSGIAPSSWADQIYGSDLSPLGNFGVSISGVQAGQPPANADFFTQYVGYLGDFVAGYLNGTGPNARAASPVNSYTDVLLLPPPDGRTPQDADGNSSLDPASQAWTFQCPGSTAWLANPAIGLNPAPIPSPVQTMCNGGPPAIAKMTFSLDGWGRMNSDEASMTAQSPLSHNFNVRWNRLAVNLNGDSIKDCTGAAPGTCNPGELWMPYNLVANGPSWVTDYYEAWHVLDTPTGFIENGQACAAGDYWTVPSLAQAANEISTFSNAEFAVRPVAGTYELDLFVEPGLNLSGIQHVQVFTDVQYWGRQSL